MRDGRPYFLSDAFYRDYPHESYPEIEEKTERPYVVYLVKTDDGTWFAIPLRSRMAHPFGFKTTDEGGLDYSKAIPIFDESYIDESRTAYVRKDELPVIRRNRHRI